MLRSSSLKDRIGCDWGCWDSELDIVEGAESEVRRAWIGEGMLVEVLRTRRFGCPYINHAYGQIQVQTLQFNGRAAGVKRSSAE